MAAALRGDDRNRARACVNDHPIGVFDSGLGGLTVLQALADLLPDEHLVYFGDTARYPYGPRTRDELQHFSREIVDVLLGHGVKMVVVACNSASAAALDLLRDSYPIPIIGVVEPGVRAAMAVTVTGHVGVIGTQMTADSKIYEQTANQLRSELVLTTLACPGFVELVEAGTTRGPRVRAVVADRLARLDDPRIDALVLGCTHYPLLARPLKEVVGRGVTLVSSADETAFEVRDILERTGWTRERATAPARRIYYTTGDVEVFRRLGARFLGQPLVDVRPYRWVADPEP